MVAVLRVLVLLWPLAEIVVLVVVADEIGFGWLVLALIGSAVLGVLVIRVLGAATLVELQAALVRQEPPTGALFRGACVLLAGMLLIVPGFISDAVALLLLIPPARRAVLGPVWRRWPRGGPGGGPGAGLGGGPGSGPRGGRSPGGGPVIIEGDYQEVQPERVELPRDHEPHDQGRTRP